MKRLSWIKKLLLSALIGFTFFLVPTVAMGAVWVQNVGLLPGTSVVFAFNSGAIDRYCAAVLKPLYGNRIGICTSATDDVGAKVNAAYATGVKSVSLSEGTFRYTTSSNLNAVKTSLTGQGNCTVLIPTVAANVDAITVSALDCHLADFFINGDKTNQASGNGITLASGGSRCTIENITMDLVKEAGIYKMPGALETFLSNISVVGSGTGLHAKGSGGIAGSNLWLSYCDNEGMFFEGAQWVNISSFRCDSGIGTSNGITIAPYAGVDANWIYLYNGDIDANRGYGVEFRIPGGVANEIKDVQLVGIQFADNSYGNNNVYDDIYFNRLGTGYMHRIDILNCIFYNAAVNDVRYRVNLSGAASNSDLKVIGNTFLAGVTGTVNMGNTNIPGTIIKDNIGYIHRGEIRTYVNNINTLTENAYNSLDNPFGQTVRVLSLQIYVTTGATATTPNLDCGIGSSATTDYTTLFNDLPGETAGFYMSTDGAGGGNQTVPQLWASGSGNRYLNMSIKDAAATGMQAHFVITVMGN